MKTDSDSDLSPPDADLVAKTRTGDQHAFAELYRRHAAAVHTVLGDHVDDAERRREIVQEVFTRAWTRIDSLQTPDRFRPWLFQIARNAGIDELRSASKGSQADLDDLDTLEAIGDDPSLVSEVRELASDLRSAFLTLKPREAAALSMTVNLGFGPTEVAAALGISYGNAKVVLHRARTRLRAAISVEMESGAA